MSRYVVSKKSCQPRSRQVGSRGMRSSRLSTCGNQISGAPRHRRDIFSVAASARWHEVSRPSTRHHRRDRSHNLTHWLISTQLSTSISKCSANRRSTSARSMECGGPSLPPSNGGCSTTQRAPCPPAARAALAPRRRPPYHLERRPPTPLGRRPRRRAGTCVEIKIYGAAALILRVNLHAIDATPARRRGGAG